jgi:hypothetical protein
MNHSPLERNLYRSDSIAYLLVEKLHWGPLSAGWGVIAIGVVFELLIALVSNTLWFSTGQIGLLQDWIPWI